MSGSDWFLALGVIAIMLAGAYLAIKFIFKVLRALYRLIVPDRVGDGQIGRQTETVYLDLETTGFSPRTD